MSENRDFLTFSEGIEMEHWVKIGERNVVVVVVFFLHK